MTPQKDFITYGVGVSLLTMRSPAKSRSRAPVRLDKVHDARTDTTTADPDDQQQHQRSTIATEGP